MNTNSVLAFTIINFLKQQGIVDYCIAPGSRNASISLTLPQISNINIHTHFDERALGFIALGIAKSTNKPVVICTTSGTAVGNLLPAIMEAYNTNIPLIVLSADRPFELYESGANQCCEQHKIFSTYADFLHIQPLSKYITIDHIYSKLSYHYSILQNSNQPLQINIEFREPLYNDTNINFDELTNNNVPKISQITSNVIATCTFEELHTKLSRKSLILVGNVNSSESLTLTKILERYDCPKIIDIQSNLRIVNNIKNKICHYEVIFEDETEIEKLKNYSEIIVFGGKFISKTPIKIMKYFQNKCIFINSYLNNNNSESIQADYLYAPYDTIYNELINYKVKPNDGILNDNIKQKDDEYNDLLNNFYKNSQYNKTEFNELDILLNLHKINISNIFLGNSLICRLADLIIKETNQKIYTNRGISGIDGLIATATGISYKAPTLAIIGDVSTLYDLSSISLLQKYPLTLIIINNNGGNIFSKFPIADNTIKEKLFINPHNTDFKDICNMFSIPYYCNFSSIDEFLKVINNDNFSKVIEIKVSDNSSFELYNSIKHIHKK